MIKNYKELDFYASEKETVWAQFDNDPITEYLVIGQTNTKYLCIGYSSSFYIKKELTFDSREDLKFNKFVNVCMAKLKSNTRLNQSRKWGVKELSRYLRETKQQVFAERFIKEYAEYLI